MPSSMYYDLARILSLLMDGFPSIIPSMELKFALEEQKHQRYQRECYSLEP